jgi:hypothetical protein
MCIIYINYNEGDDMANAISVTSNNTTCITFAIYELNISNQYFLETIFIFRGWNINLSSFHN